MRHKITNVTPNRKDKGALFSSNRLLFGYSFDSSLYHINNININLRGNYYLNLNDFQYGKNKSSSGNTIISLGENEICVLPSGIIDTIIHRDRSSPTIWCFDDNGKQ